jgi:hypothetical protein
MGKQAPTALPCFSASIVSVISLPDEELSVPSLSSSRLRSLAGVWLKAGTMGAIVECVDTPNTNLLSATPPSYRPSAGAAVLFIDAVRTSMGVSCAAALEREVELA